MYVQPTVSIWCMFNSWDISVWPIPTKWAHQLIYLKGVSRKILSMLKSTIEKRKQKRENKMIDAVDQNSLPQFCKTNDIYNISM